MASTLAELKYRETALASKLQRLLNLQSMMTKEDKEIDHNIRMTRLYLDEVRDKINEHPHR